MDLFVERINTQLRTSSSYRPCSNCIAVNVFLINQEKEKFYALALFVCFSKTLRKIYQINGILLTPDCLSKPIYPRLIEISLQIVSIPLRKANLYLPPLPWGNDALTKDSEKVIFDLWAEKIWKRYRTFFSQWRIELLIYQHCKEHAIRSTVMG